MATSDDDFTITQEELDELKEFLSTQDLKSAITTVKDYLEQQDRVELNIGVTGESGSGKSTFVNAFRGLEDEEEGSATTGVVETTFEPEVYLHPKYNNVKVWDLPGIGTPSFKADEYLEQVQFERYDFFIIIASDRFREYHTQLAKEIMRMGKKFYFVRSKIDISIAAEQRKKRFDQKKTLDIIREDCENGLRKIGIEDPVVFLISGWKLGKYDFTLLQERMEKELPQHKSRLLMLALLNITLDINEKKKKVLEKDIRKVAFLSAVNDTVNLSDLRISVGFLTIIPELQKYCNAFGLDDPSLQKLCERSGKNIEEIKSLMKSYLHQGINESSVTKLLSECLFVNRTRLERVIMYIPIFGTVAGAALSFLAVSRLLKRALNEMAEDASKVLMASLEAEI
ncbi:interferon-inducible GTPase 5-like [Garra rufa]|uniref:interferon-inducible GTPase 5-like n=1 Tax=Garra rufa TaxID=137080 RepID=UPI003CCEE78B